LTAFSAKVFHCFIVNPTGLAKQNDFRNTASSTMSAIYADEWQHALTMSLTDDRGKCH
jgi:hypothetical protein